MGWGAWVNKPRRVTNRAWCSAVSSRKDRAEMREGLETTLHCVSTFLTVLANDKIWVWLLWFWGLSGEIGWLGVQFFCRVERSSREVSGMGLFASEVCRYRNRFKARGVLLHKLLMIHLLIMKFFKIDRGSSGSNGNHNLLVFFSKCIQSIYDQIFFIKGCMTEGELIIQAFECLQKF